MRKYLIFFLLCAHPIFSQVNQKNDIQFWGMVFFEKKFNPKHLLRLNGEVRYGDNVSKLYFAFGQIRYFYFPVRWFRFGPGYRQNWNKLLRPNKWTMIYSPEFEINFIFHFHKGWVITNLHRIQYLIFENNTSSKWLSRHRLRLSYIFPVGNYYLRPFIADEVLVREGNGLFQNRASIGSFFNLTHHVETKVFYMLRNIKNNGWKPQHVFGLYVLFFF